MSLLEDIFLQDEADEAQELERVIEGDEYDERSRSRSGSPDSDENVNRDDEAGTYLLFIYSNQITMIFFNSTSKR